MSQNHLKKAYYQYNQIMFTDYVYKYQAANIIYYIKIAVDLILFYLQLQYKHRFLCSEQTFLMSWLL